MDWARRAFRREDGAGDARQRLLYRLRRDPRLSDNAVRAIALVPRELFIDPSYADAAYEDVPIQIGPDATISAPSMVAEMLTAMEPLEARKVLEIGAGSGYAAATIAALGAQVIGIELLPDLAGQATSHLAAAGYSDKVQVIAADGQHGWPAAAHYDRILVSAAIEAVPPAWFEQLADGGMLVYPEAGYGEDILVRLTKNADSYVREELGRCRFVRMQL
jgi:protein-L-isoaspartate(D-aspartate) O-methyltransferase